MILNESDARLVNTLSSSKCLSYQRLVKTTPNPSATKKSRGELVGPLVLPSSVAVGAAADEVVEADDISR